MRRLVWPILTSALMLALTVGLGVWQLERLAWKQGLLAEINRGEASPPELLTDHPSAFRRVVVHGRFLPGAVRYGAEVRSGGAEPVMGAYLVSALQPPSGPPIIVDRGWAPVDAPDAPPSGTVDIAGYVRPPEHTPWLGAADNPQARRFYALDPEAIGRSLGLATVAPFTVVALGSKNQVPEPAEALPRPPNDHLSYAITWFSLSAALVVILAVYVRQTLRSERPR